MPETDITSETSYEIVVVTNQNTDAFALSMAAYVFGALAADGRHEADFYATIDAEGRAPIREWAHDESRTDEGSLQMLEFSFEGHASYVGLMKNPSSDFAESLYFAFDKEISGEQFADISKRIHDFPRVYAEHDDEDEAEFLVIHDIYVNQVHTMTATTDVTPDV